MKKVLILGITGGFGGHVAQSLTENGWQINALVRNPEKLPERFQNIQVFKGDVANRGEVERAAADVDVIIYGVNPANYAWEGVVMPLLENVVSIAEEKSLTIIFPGNVYVYDPADGPDFSECSVQHPLTSKGVMRVEMENRLKQAADNGAKVIILRMGDFIGKGAESTWLKQIVKVTKKGYVLTAPGPQSLKHSWTNLPDAAATVTRLLERRNELDAFSVFNFKGYQVSLDNIAVAISKTSHKTVMVKKFPWFVIKLMAPFSHLFKSLIEMRYLWNQEINLDEEKLMKTLDGNVPHTSLQQALAESGLLN